MELACRMDGLTSAVFCEMAAAADEARARGIEIIDLGIGSPDLPPARHIIDAMKAALEEPDAFWYPTTQGSLAFREAVASYYARRFGVSLDPATEVHSLMGSQDGLAHLALAMLGPGDVALMPDPGYPIYHASVAIAGGELVTMPLREELGFLPDFAAVPADVARRAKLMVLNYPNNPLSVAADYAFVESAVAFARAHGILLCYDNAYSELAFDGRRPPSALQVPGAMETCVELNSLSKAFSMAGARVAYAVGNRSAVAALSCIKSHIDYGVFRVTQAGAIAALSGPEEASADAMRRYEARRDSFLSVLSGYGWRPQRPEATMFVWAKLPGSWASSAEFAMSLVREVGVTVIPGSAFGAMGEGYVRMAVVRSTGVLEEAAHRIGRFLSTR